MGRARTGLAVGRGPPVSFVTHAPITTRRKLPHAPAGVRFHRACVAFLGSKLGPGWYFFPSTRTNNNNVRLRFLEDLFKRVTNPLETRAFPVQGTRLRVRNSPAPNASPCPILKPAGRRVKHEASENTHACLSSVLSARSTPRHGRRSGWCISGQVHPMCQVASADDTITRQITHTSKHKLLSGSYDQLLLYHCMSGIIHRTTQYF